MKNIIKFLFTGLGFTLLLANFLGFLNVGLESITAAGFILAGSQYTGHELAEVFLRGMFSGWLPKATTPIFTNGSMNIKHTFLKAGEENEYLMPYADGFQGGNASNKVQKVFEIGEFKREISYSKQDYALLVQRELDEIKNAFQNDIFQNEVMQSFPIEFVDALKSEIGNVNDEYMRTSIMLTIAEIRVFQKSIAAGISKTFWLGDKYKITYAGDGSTTKFPNGVAYNKYEADKRYNVIDGVWKNIFTNASLTPTANQVQKVAISVGAVAQVQTLTLTGTSGTANVTAIGLTKLATFATNLTTTAANFVAAHATAYAERYITVTSSGAAIIFTSARPGVPFDAVTVANVSGDLAGSVAATTANTVAGDLSVNQALDIMNQMVKKQPRVMKSIPAARKVFYATRSFIENYEDWMTQNSITVSTTGSVQLDSQRNAVIDGVTMLKYKGIEIEEMPIDGAIDADFEGYAPHRCILTVKNNVVPVLSTPQGFADFDLWYNKDENLNRSRFQCEMGGDYVLPEYMVAAF